MPTKSNNIGGRGGKRTGAGRKKKALTEKVESGNPGGRTLNVLDIPDVSGVDMPKPHDFLSAAQRDGGNFQAKEIYTETWEWLKTVRCHNVVSPQLLERYAMCAARWIQCEEMTNQLIGEEKRKFLAYVNAWGVVNGEGNLGSFIIGFRLGAAFMQDTFLSDNAPYTDFLREE